MPPLMSNVKRNLIAGTVAFAMLATSVAPALAWGQRDQDFTKGVLAILLLGTIAQQVNAQSNRNKPPVYQPPVYQQPINYPPRQPPRYQPPVQSVYSTPAAQAFQSYTLNERRRIQSTLANYGYYNDNIDGNFGPATYQALTAYASRSGKMAMLETRGGAYGLMDGLLY